MAAAARGTSKHPPIRWERVLPRRSLRVLLVENDDSTRHIVIALLRKCGYHVAAVADGVKAWEVLIEKEYNFDLVLAEVDMPSFSGIGLLSRIMGDEGCKNIPVIMMSPHDSVSVVLKCMLKGAVDFLVKPVRKNELQNLWQHVWRKHCSSSYVNGSDNNAASNHISGNVVERLETGENSDEGNNAHHSGSKPEVVIGCDQEPMEPLHFGGNSNDELETKEDHVDQRLPMNFNCETEDKSRGIVAEATLPVQGSSLIEKVQTAECSYRTFPFSDGVLGLMRFKEGVRINPDSYCHNNSINEPSSSMYCFIENDTREIVYEAAKSSHKDGSYGSSSSFMQLNGCTRQEPKEGSKLKHSDNSAFSRYGYEKLCPSNPHATSSTLCIRTTNCVDQHVSHPSTDGFDNERNTSISPRKRLSSPQMKVGETPLYLQIPPNSNNDDAGFSASDPPREDACVGHSSTREDATFHPQLGYIAVPIPMGTIPYQTLCAGHHPILQPLFHCENSVSAHGCTAIGEHIGVPCVRVDQSNQTGSGSHDMLNVSWSNCSGEASNAVVNRGNALESGNESGVQNCNRKGLGHDHSRRAAALTKFRLKRKARCFEKKVRYFSRQKLAEQRPRVKGQFVRQKSLGSSKATDTEE